MSKVVESGSSHFVRDGYTWSLYLILGIFGFKLSVLGSVMPFLRDEMWLSSTQIGWHFSIYAVGLIASGVATRWLLYRFPPDTVLSVAAIAMVASILTLTAADMLAASLTSAALMGLTGGIVQAVVQGQLATHHGSRRDIAVTEAFVFAGLGVFVGPLAVGLTVSNGFDWRLAMAIPSVALGLVLMVSRSSVSHSGPDDQTRREDGIGRLPLGVYSCWFIILLGIAAEWGIGFWGAQFLESRLGVHAATGVTLMAVFFGGTIFGRLVSSRLLKLFDGNTMLLAVMALGFGSILGLWLFSSLAAAIVMLAVAGMCLGNFSPLILTAAIRQAPDRSHAISSGATQSVGAALLVVPITLGTLGGAIGLVNAVGLLAVFPVVMLAVYLGTVPQPSAKQVSEHPKVEG